MTATDAELAANAEAEARFDAFARATDLARQGRRAAAEVVLREAGLDVADAWLHIGVQLTAERLKENPDGPRW